MPSLHVIRPSLPDSNLPMTFSHGDFLDIGVSFGPQKKPLRTVSCLIEGCFLVGFARGFGYVMRLRCAMS